MWRRLKYWYITTWAFAKLFDNEEKSLPFRIFYANLDGYFYNITI